MNKPATYIEDESGVDLEASRTRLLFKARLSHGSGFSEQAEYRIGATKCGRFDVLWSRSDWVEDGPALQAIAWLPRHEMKGEALHLALLKAWLMAEKMANDTDEPKFHEVEQSKLALLKSTDVWLVVDEVFATEDPAKK